MYLGKSIEKVAGSVQLVPFCSDCNSQDIETIQTCKCCGSHNITTDWFDDRSQKQTYEDCNVYKYKCDGCGKEFSVKLKSNISRQNTNKISFVDGEFIPYSCEDSSFEYIVPGDYCNNCLETLVRKLNFEVSRLTTSSHIQSTMDKLFPKEDDKQ